MFGPARTHIDARIEQVYRERRTSAEVAAADLAVHLLDLKPGQRVCIERGPMTLEDPVAFTMITKGTVNLDAGGS